MLKVKHAICEEAGRRIRLLVGAFDEINILGAELKKFGRQRLLGIRGRCWCLAKFGSGVFSKYDVHSICSKINAESIISSVLRHMRLLEEDEDEENESAISRLALKEK